MLISGAESAWKPVTSSVRQVLVLGLVLFNIFINDLDEGVESTLSKFTDDKKLGELADTLAGCVTIQQDLNRLESGAGRDMMRFHNQVLD